MCLISVIIKLFNSERTYSVSVELNTFLFTSRSGSLFASMFVISHRILLYLSVPSSSPPLVSTVFIMRSIPDCRAPGQNLLITPLLRCDSCYCLQSYTGPLGPVMFPLLQSLTCCSIERLKSNHTDESAEHVPENMAHSNQLLQLKN